MQVTIAILHLVIRRRTQVHWTQTASVNHVAGKQASVNCKCGGMSCHARYDGRFATSPLNCLHPIQHKRTISVRGIAKYGQLLGRRASVFDLPDILYVGLKVLTSFHNFIVL